MRVARNVSIPHLRWFIEPGAAISQTREWTDQYDMNDSRRSLPFIHISWLEVRFMAQRMRGAYYTFNGFNGFVWRRQHININFIARNAVRMERNAECTLPAPLSYFSWAEQYFVRTSERIKANLAWYGKPFELHPHIFIKRTHESSDLIIIMFVSGEIGFVYGEATNVTWHIRLFAVYDAPRNRKL